MSMLSIQELRTALAAEKVHTQEVIADCDEYQRLLAAEKAAHADTQAELDAERTIADRTIATLTQELEAEKAKHRALRSWADGAEVDIEALETDRESMRQEQNRWMKRALDAEHAAATLHQELREAK